MQQQHSTRELASTAENALVWATTLAAIALLAIVVAYWTWAWLAPPPEPRLADGSSSARVASAHALFGSGTSDARSDSAYTLLGVAASSGAGQGRAIVQLDGRKTLVVGVGEEVAAGVRIAEIRATHVVLDRGGRMERLELPMRPPAAPQAAHR